MVGSLLLQQPGALLAMSIAHLATLASASSGFTEAWLATDGNFRAELAKAGLDDALTWSGLSRTALRGSDPRDGLTKVFQALGLLNCPPDEVTARLDAGLALATAASGVSRDWGQQVAALSDLQVNVDHELQAKRSKQDSEERDERARPPDAGLFTATAVKRRRS